MDANLLDHDSSGGVEITIFFILYMKKLRHKVSSAQTQFSQLSNLAMYMCLHICMRICRPGAKTQSSWSMSRVLILVSGRWEALCVPSGLVCHLWGGGMNERMGVLFELGHTLFHQQWQANYYFFWQLIFPPSPGQTAPVPTGASSHNPTGRCSHCTLKQKASPKANWHVMSCIEKDQHGEFWHHKKVN